MISLALPPIDAPKTLDDCLDFWPDTESYLSALIEAAQSCPSPSEADLMAILKAVGVPVADLTLTPLGLRAAVLGLENGHAFAHHEMRQRLAMPPDLCPEVKVWDQGTVPNWSGGVLTEPKYFSFFQDAPIHVFNPNHRRKWRAHELLHGAQGIFWHPEMTRFEFYLGARLNELLPVIHWYGFDEVLRRRCPKHQGQHLYRDFCPDCEAITLPYWHGADPAITQSPRDARHFLEGGIAHFKAEFQACLDEYQGGRAIRLPHAQLDASSDAKGYLRAHWNRVTSWSFGTYMELMLVPDRHYHPTLESALLETLKQTTRLLGGHLQLSQEDYLNRRRQRVIQDLAYRTLLMIEGIGYRSARRSDRAERDLIPHLEVGAAHIQADNLSAEDFQNWWGQLEALLAVHQKGAALEGHQRVLETGYQWPDLPWPGDGKGADLLYAGLESAFPLFYEYFEAEAPQLCQAFTSAFDPQALGYLPTRFVQWLRLQKAPAMAWEIANFEAESAKGPHKDEAYTHFAVLPDDDAALTPEMGLLRLNQTFRHLKLSPEAQELLFDAVLGPYLCAIIDGEAADILTLNREMFEMLKHLDEKGVYPEPGPTRAQLLEMGILVWLPKPKAAARRDEGLHP